MESWRRNPLVFWVINLPPTVWLVVFFMVPLGIIWVLSFGEKRGVVEVAITWTLDNYMRAFDPLYLQIFAKSFWFAGLTTFLCLAIAFPVSFFITFAPARWKPLLLLLIILPFWTNLLIRTYALIAVLRTRGFANFTMEWFWEKGDTLLALVGLGELQLIGPSYEPFVLLYNNFAVVFGLVYVHLPFMVLPLYASLDRLDRSYIEASLDLGAGQIRSFFTIVVPLAKAGVISGLIITFIPALGSFLTPDLLGGTDSQMIANVVERQFKSANDWPFGAALSFILMYITFFALAVRALLARGSSAMEAG
jgi:spermidine/putrescine transport system permease protein